MNKIRDKKQTNILIQNTFTPKRGSSGNCRFCL